MGFRKLMMIAGSVLCASLPMNAEAAVIVLGGGFAQMCYEAARAVDEPYSAQITGSRIDVAPLDICSIAISAGDLTARDLAGTYNNRGVIYFSQNMFNEAIKDFEQGLRHQNEIGELHINRGASMVALKRWADAVPSLNRGIELGALELEKAYYNRGIAYEELGDVRRAYLDYMKASSLKPEWEDPKLQLTRFTVRKKP
ncbi:MAG: tetratricopeptide repeat protein [Rhodospirillaceae bacterium]|nr:tetratricopeptide repeat protein [Rhodospirillaceae bacterium]